MIENYIKETNNVQLNRAELSYLIDFVKKQNKNMLVFGCGADTKIWASINKKKTVFLENNQDWINKTKKENFDIRKIEYSTKANQFKELLNNTKDLKIDLPFGIKDMDWGIIFVDAPVGNAEGRMQSIYVASILASLNCNTSVFVHDCDREIEKLYCDKYLEKYKLIKQIRKLRHYKS